jgi:hypothetical protein
VVFGQLADASATEHGQGRVDRPIAR